MCFDPVGCDGFQEAIEWGTKTGYIDERTQKLMQTVIQNRHMDHIGEHSSCLYFAAVLMYVAL